MRSFDLRSARALRAFVTVGGVVAAGSILVARAPRAYAADAAVTDASVTWNVAAAVGAGTGCFLGVDTMISVSGEDVSVVFTNLGVSLAGADGGPLRDTRTCTIKLPASVPLGLYPQKLEQSLTYGIRKTAGASVSLTATVTFFDVAIRTPPLVADAGVDYDGAARIERLAETYAPPSPMYASFCRTGRAESGVLTANLAARGEVTGAGESLVAFTDDLDLRWDFRAPLAACAR